MSHPKSEGDPLPAGSRLGPATLVARIGVGGVGEVYTAEIDHTRWALKILHSHLLDHPQIDARFAQEFSLLARDLHPCLPHASAFGRYDGRPFFLMRWAPGVPLLSWLEGPRSAAGFKPYAGLGWKEVFGVGRDMLAALGALHAAGVVHRDVKADNIMVGAAGAILIDLGMAAEMGSDDGEPSGLGTPCTWAPERFAGHSGKDPRCDLYAAARVLYQCIAGVDAFGFGSAGWQTRVMLGDVPPLRVFVPHLAPAWDVFFARALHKQPERRFSTSSAMWKAFTELPAPD